MSLTQYELRKQVRPILRRIFAGADGDERQTILRDALSGSSVVGQIEYDSAEEAFVAHLFDVLVNYGRVDKENTALWMLLNCCRDRFGVDYAEQVDALKPALLASHNILAADEQNRSSDVVESGGVVGVSVKPRLGAKMRGCTVSATVALGLMLAFFTVQNSQMSTSPDPNGSVGGGMSGGGTTTTSNGTTNPGVTGGGSSTGVEPVPPPVGSNEKSEVVARARRYLREGRLEEAREVSRRIKDTKERESLFKEIAKAQAIERIRKKSNSPGGNDKEFPTSGPPSTR